MDFVIYSGVIKCQPRFEESVRLEIIFRVSARTGTKFPGFQTLIKFKMDAALTELKILVVEEKADMIYRECKVAVNLRNVEGVTGEDCDYKPKLVKLERSDSNEGFGFHLLYLDDRKGGVLNNIYQFNFKFNFQ